MVRTRPRPTAPTALVRNQKAWTKRCQSRSGADWATRKAKLTLIGPLLEMTWGKCAYCESQLGVQVFAQIEHYVSRHVAPHRAFEWSNLFPVCEICNNSKRHTDHSGALLKPDNEDPEDFFWIGPEGEITPRPGLTPESAARAAETIRLCDLNRADLQEARQDVANALRDWLSSGSPAQWERLSHPRHEYKLVIRHILTIHNQPDLAAFDRRRFQTGNY
jgi:uncharacterized protein (TIGR02646 family)